MQETAYRPGIGMCTRCDQIPGGIRGFEAKAENQTKIEPKMVIKNKPKEAEQVQEQWTINLVSWNVRHMNTKVKKDRIFDELRNMCDGKTDLIHLTETRLE